MPAASRRRPPAASSVDGFVLDFLERFYDT
jgi:hypothetical protein